MLNLPLRDDSPVASVAGRDAVHDASAGAAPSASVAAPGVRFIDHVRDRLVAGKGLHDLSRNARFARFPLIGYRTSAAALDFVAFCVADGLTEEEIVGLRDEFFEAVRHVAREFGVRPRGRNPNGLLGFVFQEGCTESMARFIRTQTRIAHGAGTGAVTVSWAIDLAHRRIHVHQNPVSVLPPVFIVAQTVFPGLAWLQATVDHVPEDPPSHRPAGEDTEIQAPSTPEPPPASTACDQVRILFLGANSTTRPLDLEREVARIEDDIRMAPQRDTLEFRYVGAVTRERLMRAMLDRSPTIVHFAGHGRTEGIFLRDERGDPRLVTGDALARLFDLFRETVRCVVLNACWSEAQARAIRSHVPHVIGTRAGIPDDAALAFSSGFYQAIAAGKGVPFAFEMGKASAHLDGSGGEDLFVLL